MGVRAPTEMASEFAKRLNGRDKSGLLELYAEGALLTIDGSAVAHGKAEIEQVMAPFFDAPLRFVAQCSSCLQSGDTALVRTDWELVDPAGAVAMAGASAEVLQRQKDGLWRFVVDDATYASRSAAGR